MHMVNELETSQDYSPTPKNLKNVEDIFDEELN